MLTATLHCFHLWQQHQVAPVPLAEVVSQLSGSAFTGSAIGQQIAEAQSNGDSQSFAPLLLSTVQLLETRTNATASANGSTQAIATAENTQVRTLLLESVQTLADNTFSTVDAIVQQAQMITSISSNPEELSSEFRVVRCNFTFTLFLSLRHM